MHDLGHLEGEIQRKTKTFCVDFAIVTSEKKFRDMTSVDHIHNVTSYDVKILPLIERVNVNIPNKQRPDAKHVFCRALKIPSAMGAQVKTELAKRLAQGTIFAVEPGGVMNVPPVVWQKKKSGSPRLCADFKVHLKDKVMTETTLLMTWTFLQVLEGSIFSVTLKIDISSAYYHTDWKTKGKIIAS